MKEKKSKGFTLVEVVLAIAIGIIIVIGAILGYSSVRQTAAEREGRDKLGHCKGIITSYIAANNGVPPALADLQKFWVARRKDFKLSPWGGQAEGVSGLASATYIYLQGTYTTATYYGDVIYTTSAATFSVADFALGAVSASARGYAIAYVDNNGNGPLFTLVGE